jgi:diguanylate cyclase (GGDEF)-like protein
MHAEDTRSEADEAHAALMAVDGRVLGTLDWTPQKPGTILLATAATPILAVVFGLILAAFYFYTRGRKSTESLIASEARAKHMALHDALTSLPNRLLFSDRLGHALQSLRRDNEGVAVLCIDLDHFKDVNDTLGHHCGDALLCEVAARLTAACRSSDTLARLGGDEFAVVQSRATPASAAALGERIIQALRGPVSLPAGEATLSCSVGATLITQPGQDAGEVVRQADIALYQAKDRGRGQVRFFEPEMDAALRARKLIEADLQKALANNELFMAFQPQMDGHGQMTGVEALMRWTHPERGPISPAFFIPIAEQSRLIHDLGRFALEEAFGASCRWPSLKVAVNVSAHQLRAPDFLREVKQMVAKSGVDPRNVDLEITEGVLLDDDSVTHDVLKRLKHMGFTLALDDFGTGYSSLSYLRRYPVDKIKIDRSFITGLGVDRESEAVVGAIVRLAKALNLEVIAEGVETDGQRTELGRAGCSNIQGFLFGRPETPAQIDHRLVGRSKARPLNALAS